MYEYAWYQWLTFFFIYCFFGWIFESSYVSLKKKHFVNRGFLRLPMLPLYGTAVSSKKRGIDTDMVRIFLCRIKVYVKSVSGLSDKIKSESA